MNTNRPILKRKLAQPYYPGYSEKRALKKFRAEIDETPGLLEALKAQNYKPTKNFRYFSSAQIRLIVKRLGEPS